MPREHHVNQNVGWLRAAVLGANDGIVSTASLMLGVAASSADAKAVLLSGVAGLVAGAMSMAAGEYVSVSSQADSENADIAREKEELAEDDAGEHAELAAIYVKRGLSRELATQVAVELMKHDALDAHLRDELGMTEHSKAKPVQAALASAASFSVGALIPLLTAWLAPVAVGPASLIALAIAGGLAAKAGGAKVGAAIARVVFWGALAMAFTAGIGKLFGVVVN